ncbi:regulatory signaling modulator protein AmpE [Stenotrophomonas sp. SY1]|uniref:regulatory signaling modulator protein AmpE n=1 Tax=Stenotrophomonas sp. SY1 TaxID=477235 RepID=UPI001E2CA139|nr:regulatory signaling modulator protein AmpE [Stenotrophomonas sp. SY1]MCD9088344.1 regulatory signaling modulator protein AmpE [Stenotrophomonas sp. SY1]
MFTTLVAVIAALVLGHLAPSLMTALRDWRWYERWLAWLQAHAGQSASSRYGLALAIAPCVLLVASLQWLLDERLYGLPSLLFGVAVLALCWGPRDLDRDVEAVIDADDAGSRDVAIANMQSAGGSMRQDAPSLVEATVVDALRRWFAPLFWFLLLGPLGAVLYRLLALAVQGPAATQVAAASREGGSQVLALLEWPVAQLMTLTMALVGNFDTVFTTWRQSGGNRWALELGFLGRAARASVGVDLVEEADEARLEGLEPVDERYPELRDAMSLVWRMLLLWMALLALLVIAGWVG